MQLGHLLEEKDDVGKEEGTGSASVARHEGRERSKRRTDSHDLMKSHCSISSKDIFLERGQPG
jgi:hypothetical protein